MTAPILPPDGDGYASLLAELEDRVRAARLTVAVAVNQEFTPPYWSIRRDFLKRQSTEGWGVRVIDRLASDLRSAFPEMTDLVPRNRKYIRSVADAFPEAEIVQQVVARLPGAYVIDPFEGIKEPTERLLYAWHVGGPPGGHGRGGAGEGVV